MMTRRNVAAHHACEDVNAMSAPASALPDVTVKPRRELTNAGRLLMLTTAFLGWLCAGFLLSITSVCMQPAAIDLLARADQLDRQEYLSLSARGKPKPASVPSTASALSTEEKRTLEAGNVLVGKWVAWLKCAFLFGAAAGGLFFGALGDRFGRTKGMGLAILTYSVMAGAAYFSQQPSDLLVCWFLACMGVGGMWPNGVALVSEAWSSLSRTASAGIIGSAANIGIFLMSSLMTWQKTDSEHWRWVMLIAAAPIVLAAISFLFVPESPLWLAQRARNSTGTSPAVGKGEIFRPPYLWVTLVGITLATIPIVGGWGSADWMVQWADRAGSSHPSLKAEVNQARAMTGIIGSLLGGWIASVFGRRQTYFLASLGALVIAQYTFWYVVPTDRYFLWWVSALGLFSGIYFGWLPFCLPELFPTRVRSAGAGVSFNFGRILTAITVFATGALMSFFKGDYAQIGRVTSLIFVFGLIVIWFVPDTSQKRLEE